MSTVPGDQERNEEVRASAIINTEKATKKINMIRSEQIKRIGEAKKIYYENLQKSREILKQKQEEISKQVNVVNIRDITNKRLKSGLSNLDKILSVLRESQAGGKTVSEAIADPTIQNIINQLKIDLSNYQSLLENEKKANIQKDEFASMISHELKTPLVTISGYCEMLKDGSLGNITPDQLDAITEIHQSSNRLERLIRDLLDAQKLEMGRLTLIMEDFSLESFMKNTYKDLSPMLKQKQLEFVNNTMGDMMINADKDRLFQIFRNIVANSVDFTPEHGRIEIGAQSGDNQVLFFIKDNGVGILKEKQEKLFSKFYQADTSFARQHGGTGLGLVICKGIVEVLGGKIWIESDVGKGTSVYFTMPITRNKVQ